VISTPRVDDVCILIEGTYPYVSGGVSSWLHDIIRGHPELSFSILNIGSHVGVYGKPRYVLPDNVAALHHIYCHEAIPGVLTNARRDALNDEIRVLRNQRDTRVGPSRVLSALKRLHLGDAVDAGLLADLVSDDLSVGAFLHGRESFQFMSEMAEQLAPETPFLEFFWHCRSIHVPILRLLSAPIVPARSYHALSTGYAGLVGAAFSVRSGRPLVVTEHGIYTRERDIDLANAVWIKDQSDGLEEEMGFAPTPSPLRRVWSRSFAALAKVAYHQAARLVTLSDANRAREIADGAAASKITIVPNGVDVDMTDLPTDVVPPPKLQVVRDAGTQDVVPCHRPRLRVGFVGRVVPIKDVITFIKACNLAMATVDLDVRIIGPAEEDPPYAQRCRNLVETLGRVDTIKFVGPMPSHLIYRDLDVVVLTSFSEGQPLVMLEAYAAGLPAIATDVGACREMIEGVNPADHELGPSGFVTRVATPIETARAMITLAQDPALRRRFGAAGRHRVVGFYQRRDMIQSYRAIYQDMVSS